MSGKRAPPKTLFAFFLFLKRRFVGGPVSTARRPTGCADLISGTATAENPMIRGRPRAVVCSLEGALLRSSSTFPYFMLVALETGGLLRALLLLLLYPILCCVDEEVGLRVMAMLCFRGVREEQLRLLGKVVLPKRLLQDVGLEGFQVLVQVGGGGKKVCITGMPRVMVETTLKEYLGVDAVVGRELRAVGGYYTGVIAEGGADGRRRRDQLLLLGDEKAGDDDGDVLWVGGCRESRWCRANFFSLRRHDRDLYRCVSETEKAAWRPLPRENYLKPLVFHDGRIVFKPTPAAALAMFVWLPLGLLLAVLRIAILFWLPAELLVPLLAFTGTTNRLVRSPFTPSSSSSRHAVLVRGGRERRRRRQHGGRLYACNHRTLVDAVYVSGALGEPVTTVTYSVSRLSELIAPIKTVRLSREREGDRRRMEAVLSEGDLVVSPEGTTCREPYLLRFSPLFAEVARGGGVVPVALDARLSMFYGTSTAGGRKWMDPVFFAMDPFPSYTVEFLEEVPVAAADGTRRSSYEVANQVQRELGRALGFECTVLTRKDKYLMLAGNEGFVDR